MMNKPLHTTIILLLCCLGWSALPGQTGQRFIDSVFTTVRVTDSLIYGENVTVLTLQSPAIQAPTLQPLAFDFYEPAGDTMAERPLIIMLHTGNFLPYTLNGTTVGHLKDSVNVELATRLAQRGYTVAVASYRVGWNPSAETQILRAFSIIQAAYRAVQDARTAIRYFRRDAEENGNTYGIDPDRITLWGIGTGGYVSIISATLDDIDKIGDTEMPPAKFLLPNADPPPDFVSMIQEPFHGDIYGWGFPNDEDTIRVNELNNPGPPLELGDYLLAPNHLNISSDFDLVVNMGGDIGDISWLEADDVPIIDFHVPTDPFAPYRSDVLLVGSLGIPIVEVQGGKNIVEKANELGVNDAFSRDLIAATFPDHPQLVDITDSAAANSMRVNDDEGPHDYYEGLYPFVRPGEVESSPWNWWDPAFWSAVPSIDPGCPGNVHDCTLPSNPDMSKAKAMAYIDTIMWYFLPRAYLALELPEIQMEIVASTETLLAPETVDLQIWPNPATERLFIRSAPEFPMQRVELYDGSGRLLRAQGRLHADQVEWARQGLPPGMYFLKVTFEQGVAARQVIFH